MPGSRLKIGFHGDEKTSEQISIIPFRDGDDVRYFVVRDMGAIGAMRCEMVRIMGWDQLIEYLGEVWEGEEGLRSWGWLLGRAGRWRGVLRRGDGAIIMRGSRDTASRTSRGTCMSPASKWAFQVIEDGRRFWFEGVELGRAKAGSIDEVIARITGGADDHGAEGKKRKVRIIARIRVGGRDDESSTAYYAYIDGERYVLSKNPHLLLRMAGAGRYQQVFGKHGFDHVMDCEALGVGRRAHDSPVYRVKSFPNGWYGWCIDIRYLLDGWMVMPRAWERLEKFMKWKYKRKYGRLPSGEELKKVKGELYVSEIMRRNMEMRLG